MQLNGSEQHFISLNLLLIFCDLTRKKLKKILHLLILYRIFFLFYFGGTLY